VLQDRGERDEHGMQPIDSIFSPHEARAASSDDDESAGSGSVDMSLASSKYAEWLSSFQHAKLVEQRQLIPH
jgi:hypothetical protein